MATHITGEQIRAEVKEVCRLLNDALGPFAGTAELPDLLGTFDSSGLRRERERLRGEVDLYCRFALASPDGQLIQRAVEGMTPLALALVYDRVLLLIHLRDSIPDEVTIEGVPDGTTVRDIVLEHMLFNAGGVKHVA